MTKDMGAKGGDAFRALVFLVEEALWRHDYAKAMANCNLLTSSGHRKAALYYSTLAALGQGQLDYAEAALTRVRHVGSMDVHIRLLEAAVAHSRRDTKAMREAILGARKLDEATSRVIETKLERWGLLSSAQVEAIAPRKDESSDIMLLAEPPSLLRSPSPVFALAWSPDGTRLASGALDRYVRVYDSGSCKEPRTLEGHSGAIRSVAWSPDGTRLASASVDGGVIVWNTETHTRVGVLIDHKASVNAVSWSPDGRRMATGSSDKLVMIWDALALKAMKELKGHRALVGSVTWSPDGKRMASASDDGTIRIWDTDKFDVYHALEGRAQAPLSELRIAWSPDGRHIVSAPRGSRAIAVWSAVEHKEVGSVRDLTSGVNDVGWSPDGLRIASAMADGTVRVWDALTFEEVVPLKGHSSSVNCLAWSPDGKHLASGSDDRTIRIWNVDVVVPGEARMYDGECTDFLRLMHQATIPERFFPRGGAYADDRLRLAYARFFKALYDVHVPDDEVLRAFDSTIGSVLAESDSDPKLLKLADAQREPSQEARQRLETLLKEVLKDRSVKMALAKFASTDARTLKEDPQTRPGMLKLLELGLVVADENDTARTGLVFPFSSATLARLKLQPLLGEPGQK